MPDAPKNQPESIRESIQSTPILSVSAEPPPAPPLPTEPVEERSRAFLGREVVDGRRFPWFSAILILVGLPLTIFGFVQRSEPALIFGPMLSAWGVVFGLRWFFPVRYRFTETGFSRNRPKTAIDYADIDEVFKDRGKKDQFPIYVLHRAGTLVISPRIDQRSSDLFAFLKSQFVGERKVRATPKLFDAFMKQQLMVCSPREIHVFRGGGPRRASGIIGWAIRFGLGLILPAPIWFYAATLGKKLEFLFAAGGGFLTLGLIFAVVGLLGGLLNRPRVKNWKNAVLIVTPDAIALEQGDLRGELRWSELQGVARMGSFQLTSDAANAGAGIALKVQGASITIADVYDRPIEYIHALIREYSGF